MLTMRLTMKESKKIKNWSYNEWSKSWHNMALYRFIHVVEKHPMWTVEAFDTNGYTINLFHCNSQEEGENWLNNFMDIND